jgi:hypothetical protein
MKGGRGVVVVLHSHAGTPASSSTFPWFIGFLFRPFVTASDLLFRVRKDKVNVVLVFSVSGCLCYINFV